MSKNFRLFAAVATLVLGVAEARAQSPAPAADIEAAKREGAIEFVWPLFGGQPEIDALTAAFVKIYGFRPVVRATPITDIPAVTAKLIQEQKAGRKPSTDFIIGSETHVSALMDADALETVDWSGYASVPSSLLEADGRVMPIITRLPGVTYNSSTVPPADVPHTVEDFLKTRHTIATTPYGANLNILAARPVWGPERALALAKALSAKASGLINCGHAGRLLTGEFDMFGLDCGSLEALKYAARGAPLRAVILRDAAIVSYLYVGIPKGVARPAMARLFTAMMLSRDGQDALSRFSFADLHKLAGSRTAAEVKQAEEDGAKFVDVDIAFARANAAEVAKLRPQFIRILERK